MEAQPNSDLSDYLAAIKRRRMLLAVIALPILAIALALALGLPDVYVARSLIEFEEAKIPGKLPAQNTGARRAQDKSYADLYVDSLTGVVLSKASLQRLLAEIDPYPELADDPEAAVRKLLRNTTVQTVRVPVLDPDSGREREVVSAFTIAFESRDPDMAKRVASWLTGEFLSASRRHLQDRVGVAVQFYAQEADRLGGEIAQLEARLAEFKAENFGQLPELTDVNLSVMDRTERDLENVQMQIRSLQQERIFITQQLETARNQSADTNLLERLEAEYAQKEAIYDENHPDLVALRRQIENLRSGGPAPEGMTLQQQLEHQRAVLAQARLRYSDDHPDVRRIQRRIEGLEGRIAAGETGGSRGLRGNPATVQLSTQLNGINTQIAALTARSAELRAKLAQLERRVEATPMVEREYQTLTRDLDLARTKYDELLKTRMDAELTQAAIAGGGADELRLVQPAARPSQPAKPARPALALIGLVLAVFAGFTAVVVAEMFDQSVRGSRDVRRLLDLSPIGVIPSIHDAAAVRRQRLQAVTLAGFVFAGGAALLLALRSWS